MTRHPSPPSKPENHFKSNNTTKAEDGFRKKISIHEQDIQSDCGNDNVVEPSRPSSRNNKENQKTPEEVKLPELSKSPEKSNNNTSMIECMVNCFSLDLCFCGMIFFTELGTIFCSSGAVVYCARWCALITA